MLEEYLPTVLFIVLIILFLAQSVFKKKSKKAKKAIFSSDAISDAICPYCKNKLDQRPQRKKKCPSCNNFIFVRDQRLVTEERAKIIDGLKLLEIPESRFDELKEKKNNSGIEVNYIEIIKELFNKNQKNKNYYAMAVFLNKNNEDFFYYLKKNAENVLNEIKSRGDDEVILMGGSCPSCQKLKGKVLKVDDALREMPIPNKNCTHILHDKTKGFCRCLYYSKPLIIEKIE